MRDAEGVGAARLQMAAELLQVGAVGIERVARETALELEVGEEVEHEVLVWVGVDLGDGHLPTAFAAGSPRPCTCKPPFRRAAA